MPIRPIDLQTNIGQIHEVGKGEQTRTEAAVEQQHVLEKEAGEKSRLVNSRLDELRKGDNAVINDRQKHTREQAATAKGRRRALSSKQKKRETIDDDSMGQFIDVRK